MAHHSSTTLLKASCWLQSGGALGIMFAHWGTSFIAQQLPDGIPRLLEASVDVRVLVFTLAFSLMTGLVVRVSAGVASVAFEFD